MQRNMSTHKSRVSKQQAGSLHGKEKAGELLRPLPLNDCLCLHLLQELVLIVKAESRTTICGIISYHILLPGFDTQ